MWEESVQAVVKCEGSDEPCKRRMNPQAGMEVQCGGEAQASR